MNLIKDYIDYLKNNPKHYWFKRKVFGWGWTPATFEGWLTLLAFLILVFGSTTELAQNPNPSQDMVMIFSLRIVVGVIALLTVCVLTGEEPKWQWGFPRDKKK